MRVRKINMVLKLDIHVTNTLIIYAYTTQITIWEHALFLGCSDYKIRIGEKLIFPPENKGKSQFRL